MVSDLDPQTAQVRQFVFNGDNKQKEVIRNGVSVGKYFYDGDGKRVRKDTATETTIFVYSAGKLVAEYSTQVSPTPTISYTTTDHLGTPRIITNQLGEVTSRRDFLPFGDEIAQNIGERTEGLKYVTTPDNIRQKFTGYQKDSETLLDFAEARMYENRFGRFTAVDPLLASGRSANPQTFNRYAYTSNNPVVRIDKNGKEWYYSWEKIDGKFYATPRWCSGFGCTGPRWESEVRSTVDGITTVWKGGMVFQNNYSGGFTALDPFENRQINTFATASAAQAQVTQWRKQAIVNFVAGALNGASLVVSVSGADGLVAERGSEMYAVGQRAGVGSNIASAITGVGLVNALVSRFGRGAISIAKEIKLIANGTTVIGRTGHYEKVANALGANYFHIADEVWEGMSDAERWSRNQAFLDDVIARGDDIVLSDSVSAARQGSFFRRELEYLYSRGYTLSEDGLRLVRPQ